MTEILTPDICVIGAGSGGLSVAAGAAQMGADVVLIEKHKMGGDCLNYGCVPSKALLAAGKHAQYMRVGARFGVSPVEPEVDFAGAMTHVENVIKKIEPHDSVERFEGLGCTVLLGEARFMNPREVSVAGKIIRAKKFVVATGSRPAIPPIPGLAETPYFTNETIFENRHRPEHLLVIGGGPIGLEMAQAHRRLGAQVTIIEQGKVAARDDSDLSAILLNCLRDEGIEILEGARVERAATTDHGVVLGVSQNGETKSIHGTHVLVAVGRVPNCDALGLEAAGVDFSPKGVSVDKGLRTSNRRVFAIGDVIGGPQFTHVAGYHAGIIIRRLLFRVPAKYDHALVPHVTYTDPELAQIGLTEADGQAQNIKTRIVEWPLWDNDRATAEGIDAGLVKIVCAPNGKIVGAGIVGPGAGELLAPFTLAMSKGMKIGDLASLQIAYPTLSEVPKRAAGSWYTPTLYSDRTKRIVRLLLKLFG